MQTLLANGDLVRVMLLADLARVDREAFETLLVPQPVSTDWTPVDQYGAKLRDWNTRFKLGFTKRQIDALVAELPAHAGSLQPTSITLATGKGLQHDWDVVMQILMHELRQVGVGLGVYIAGSRISCYPGSGVASNQRCLEPVLLDLERFWKKQGGVSVQQVRKTLQGQSLPAIEVAWLLAFSPQMYVAMDGETVPKLWASGLVVDSENAPDFGRSADQIFVYARWDGCQWSDYSVPVFSVR